MTTDTQIQKQPRPRSAALTIKDWMSAPAMQTALRAALAGYMDEQTFAAQCYLAAQDPKLKTCTAESLFKAFLQCAQMGLLPGPHHRHVALIPRAGEVDASPQWQGFKFLMERQPGVRRVLPVLVHDRDQFRVNVDGSPSHEYDPFDDDRVFLHPDAAKAEGKKSGLRGGYLVIEYTDGRETEYHYVSAQKINRNRLCAETQKVWTKWFPEQCLKTVIRDAFARRVIPIDPQLVDRIGRAEDTDNASLGNDPARVVATVQPATRTEELAARFAPAATLPNPDDAPPDASAAIAASLAQPQAEPAVATSDADDSGAPPDDVADQLAARQGEKRTPSGGNAPLASRTAPLKPGDRDGWAAKISALASSDEIVSEYTDRAGAFRRHGVLAERRQQTVEELTRRGVDAEKALAS